MRGFDYQTDAKLGETATSLVKKTEYPLEKQAGSWTLIDMRGLDYCDARWDELLNQLDYEYTARFDERYVFDLQPIQSGISGQHS